MKLSVCIIARDEERHIGAALASAAPLADELVVLLDPRTTDRTASIAAEHGARIVRYPFRSFPHQRNVALNRCRGEWLLFLDADERLTAELQHEIRTLLTQDTATRRHGDAETRSHEADDGLISLSQPSGYWIPRYNLYFGRRLRGGGWYPDHQLRLLRRTSARYDEARLVHELVQLDGTTDELHGHLLHINIESWLELRLKQRRYAIADAQTLARNGVRAKWRNFVLQPLREINRRFVTWHGYRDGALGLVLALTMGYYELIKYVHLKALDRVRE